jgi:hypothetical protein
MISYDEMKKLVVGQTTATASINLDDIGYTLRESVIDGKPQVGTMELRSNRVNVETSNGLVVKIIGIG